MKIVADPNIPGVSEAFASLGEVTRVPGRQINPASVRDAELLLVRSVTPVNADLLEGSQVKFVATATIGFDHIDLDYLAAKKIGFASAAGSNANSVAEFIIGAMLELAHRQKFRLRDKTLGVIGVGNVGTCVVRYARALGMRVLANDPPRQRAENLPDFSSLDQVLAEADLITFHVPLTKTGPDKTSHLLDKERLHALNQRRPILLNSARGSVIDNAALTKAINGDWISGAVLDVWENEPKISAELLDIVEIGTPHIAGYSYDGKINGVRMIYDAACRFFGQVPAWEPVLPPPPVPQVELSVSSGEDDEDIIRRIVRRVYDITADDARLRSNVLDFDKLRTEYPMRREFFNTKLVVRGATAGLTEKLAALGFRL